MSDKKHKRHDEAEELKKARDIEIDDSEENSESYTAEDVKQLVEQMNALEKERDDYKDKLLRSIAELENYRKRTLKEKQEMLQYANEKLLSKLIELLDDIDKAVESGQKSVDYNALLQGFEMIQKKAYKLFEEAGVKVMEDPVGKDFNVDLHDALLHMPSEHDENKVAGLIQKGYMLNDKVLRHAKVITSSGPADKTE